MEMCISILIINSSESRVRVSEVLSLFITFSYFLCVKPPNKEKLFTTNTLYIFKQNWGFYLRREYV